MRFLVLFSLTMLPAFSRAHSEHVFPNPESLEIRVRVNAYCNGHNPTADSPEALTFYDPHFPIDFDTQVGSDFELFNKYQSSFYLGLTKLEGTKLFVRTSVSQPFFHLGSLNQVDLEKNCGTESYGKQVILPVVPRKGLVISSSRKEKGFGCMFSNWPNGQYRRTLYYSTELKIDQEKYVFEKTEEMIFSNRSLCKAWTQDPWVRN